MKEVEQNLDELNKLLLKAKVANPDISTTKLAEMLGVSQSTISNRLRSSVFKKAYAPFEMNVDRLKDLAEKKAWRTLIKNMNSSDEKVRNQAANSALTAIAKDPERATTTNNNLFIFKTSISGDGTIRNEKIAKPQTQLIDITEEAKRSSEQGNSGNE